MPRPAKGARLYLSPGEGVWLIRDGPITRRTGCGAGDRAGAEKALGEYLSTKFQPAVRESHLARISVAEVLTAYGREHAPHTKGTSASNAGYNIAALLPFWGQKTLADIRGNTCRAYVASRRRKEIRRPDGSVEIRTLKDSTIRRELVTLSAAIGHWHREHGPLESVPVITFPDTTPSKADWLSRQQAAWLLAGALGFYREFWCDVASRREHWRWRRDRGAVCRHAARFILLGFYTGTRHRAILETQWLPNTVGGWIDLERGVMHRRGLDEGETKKRRPPVRLGSRILAHLRRWKRIDERERQAVAASRPREDRHKPVYAFLHVVAYEGFPIDKLRKESVTPHILRHTRATLMMQNGVEIWQAAGFLGMSPKILEGVYGHHHPDFQKQAAEV
jgi:integrase